MILQHRLVKTQHPATGWTYGTTGEARDETAKPRISRGLFSGAGACWRSRPMGFPQNRSFSFKRIYARLPPQAKSIKIFEKSLAKAGKIWHTL